MEYVHELTDEFTENLKQMLISDDIETIEFALAILNYVNLSDYSTKIKVISLLLNNECKLGIKFETRKLNSAEKFDIFQNTDYYLDEYNKNNFKFYSARL